MDDSRFRCEDRADHLDVALSRSEHDATAEAKRRVLGMVPVLSGHWISPAEGATVGSRQTLVAWPSSALDDVAITRVVFHARWDGGEAEVCSATVDDADGLWSCNATLVGAGVPAGPVVLTFDVFDDAGDMSVAADVVVVTLTSGSSKVVWAKGTTKDASHVTFGDPVELVARVSDSADLQEVRFTAYYPDWANAKDAARVPGFDPKSTWRVMAICRPKGVTGAQATTKGCHWDGDKRSATVTFRWDPTIGEKTRSLPGVPKADPAITSASKACVPVTLGIGVSDAAGAMGTSPAGRVAGRCDARADALGRVVYLDPLTPPRPPTSVRIALILDRVRCPGDGPCEYPWRLSWNDVDGDPLNT